MSKEGVAGATLSLRDLIGVFESLAPDEWAAPSACSGWRVQDLGAHVSSNLKELADPTPPPEEPPPPMKAEDAMEALVAPRRSWTSEEVMDELRRYVEPALAVLSALQAEPTASSDSTLADLGTYPTHMLADAFAFDFFCHLHNDLLHPRGPLERTVAPVDAARLVPAVGWMMAGIPQMCGPSLGNLTGTLVLELSGPAAGSWLVAGSEGRWAVDRLTPPHASSDATIRSGSTEFVLWGTKREPWRDSVQLDGDRDLAAAFLDRLDIV